MTRVITCAAVAALFVALLCVQLASDAFCAQAAAPVSLPRLIPLRGALAVYDVLDRAAPAAYVETSLARYDLDHGDVDGATAHAIKLLPSPERNDLLARIALRRHEPLLALEYFFAAPDVPALQLEVRRIARSDPEHAYWFEQKIRLRLVALRTHPDAVAETSWTMGRLATTCAQRSPHQRLVWLRRALRDDLDAVRLSPFAVRYLRAAALDERALGDRAGAERYGRRMRRVDPNARL